MIVVERTGVACAASGKSGGFLALDWCDGSPLGRLARRSFDASCRAGRRRLDGSRWGYRRLDTWSVLAGADAVPAAVVARRGPAWLGERALVQGRLGTQATTAQVHPARFTEAMLQAAIGMGASCAGLVTDVVLDPGRTTAWASWSTARCSRPMPWSSRWGHGPWRPCAGCRCRRCTG